MKTELVQRATIGRFRDTHTHTSLSAGHIDICNCQRWILFETTNGSETEKIVKEYLPATVGNTGGPVCSKIIFNDCHG